MLVIIFISSEFVGVCPKSRNQLTADSEACEQQLSLHHYPSHQQHNNIET